MYDECHFETESGLSKTVAMLWPPCKCEYMYCKCLCNTEQHCNECSWVEPYYEVKRGERGVIYIVVLGVVLSGAS